MSGRLCIITPMFETTQKVDSETLWKDLRSLGYDVINPTVIELNGDVDGLDPWNPKLTTEEKAAIMDRCRTDPAYFFKLVLSSKKESGFVISNDDYSEIPRLQLSEINQLSPSARQEIAAAIQRKKEKDS